MREADGKNAGACDPAQANGVIAAEPEPVIGSA